MTTPPKTSIVNQSLNTSLAIISEFSLELRNGSHAIEDYSPSKEQIKRVINRYVRQAKANYEAKNAA